MNTCHLKMGLRSAILIFLSVALAGGASAQATLQVDARSTTDLSFGGILGPTIDVHGYSGGLFFEASGSWCSSKDYCTGPCASPALIRTTSGPGPGTLKNMLMGQWIGVSASERTPIVFIGERQMIPVPHGTTAIRLFFNDDALAYNDNTGAVSVKVTPVSPCLLTWSCDYFTYLGQYRCGFTPGRPVVFAWSTGGVARGAGNEHWKKGMRIDLLRPLLIAGIARADANGEVYLHTWNRDLPRKFHYFPLYDVWIQCYEVGKNKAIKKKSNVVKGRTGTCI